MFSTTQLALNRGGAGKILIPLLSSDSQLTGAERINWSGSSTEILFPLITEFVMKQDFFLSIVLLFSTELKVYTSHFTS